MIVQVAGLHDPAEALACVAAGATHLGFPLGPGVRTPDAGVEQVAAICASLPAGVSRVLITYLTDPEAILDLACRASCDWVQLHAPLPDEAVFELARLSPGLTLSVTLAVPLGAPPGDAAAAHLRRAARIAPVVGFFFTDTLDPATGHRGATGLLHDLETSARLARELPRPLILAGGLTPDNVAMAVARVRPAGVDAHSGLEDAFGRKDPAKVAAFAARARAALGR